MNLFYAMADCKNFENVDIAWGDVLEVRIPLSSLETPNYFRASEVALWLNNENISRTGDIF